MYVKVPPCFEAISSLSVLCCCIAGFLADLAALAFSLSSAFVLPQRSVGGVACHVVQLLAGLVVAIVTDFLLLCLVHNLSLLGLNLCSL